MEPQEIRKRYPELANYSDDELRQLNREVQGLAKLIVHLIRTRPIPTKEHIQKRLQQAARKG